jgi:hypothetical protein
MAVSFESKLGPRILEVILSRDSALSTDESLYPELLPLPEGESDEDDSGLAPARTRFGAAYARYLTDLDESGLRFVEGEVPTRWHLRLGGSVKDSAKKNDITYQLAAQLKKENGGKIDTSAMPVFTLMLETVRVSLVDVKTGGQSHFKKGKGGLAHDDVLAVAMGLDGISELYTALSVDEKAVDVALAKKNSPL